MHIDELLIFTTSFMYLIFGLWSQQRMSWIYNFFSCDQPNGVPIKNWKMDADGTFFNNIFLYLPYLFGYNRKIAKTFWKTVKFHYFQFRFFFFS